MRKLILKRRWPRLCLQLHRELIEAADAVDGAGKSHTVDMRRMEQQVAELTHAQQQHLRLIAEQVSRVQPWI